MSGRPYRSLLIPHVSFIRAHRQRGATWQEVAAALDKEHGIQIGAAGVQRFFARTSRRKVWPLGMEPDDSTADPTLPASAEPTAARGIFGGTSRGKTTTPMPAGPLASRPHRSAMAPHLPFITEQRAARASWAQIADALKARKGVSVTRQAVAEYFARVQAHEQKQRGQGENQESRQDAPTAFPSSFPTSEPTAPAARPAEAGPDPFAGTDALDTLAPLPRRKKP